jgi:hypothetical protein
VAFWVGEGPVRAGIGRMFAVFSGVEGLDVKLFADRDAAIAWLREVLPAVPVPGA